VRRSFASLLLIVVCALAVAGSAAAEPERAPSLAALLARHVPVLVLHPDESFQPVSVDGFLADSDLTRKTAAGSEPVPGRLPAGGADLRLDQRLCTAFDGLAATSCYLSAEAAHGAAPVVYGAVFRTRDRIDLQYWLWYPYDDFSPAYPATDFWQVHEGDWEAVSVILDRAGTPLTVAYSQHRKGRRRAWALTPKRGLRPLVYVALGSHANFPSPGEHPLVPPAVDDQHHAGVRDRPACRPHREGDGDPAGSRPGDLTDAVVDDLRRSLGGVGVRPHPWAGSARCRGRSARTHVSSAVAAARP
jgi:hypothetical protein